MRRLLPLLFALVAGCASVPPAADTPADSVSLKPVTVAELKDIVASHKGKVVVIDCWFRGCPPCVKKFPHMMDLRRELEKDGMVLMTLDVYLEEYKIKDEVLEFLRKQKSTGPNYIFKDHEDFADKWKFENKAMDAPALVVYDRDGVKVDVPKFEGNFTAQWAAEEKWLRELVAKR